MAEIWKDIPGEYNGLYQVSDKGRIRRVAPNNGTHIGRILTPTVVPVGKGYHTVTLSKNSTSARVYVHRLVARAFHGLPPRKHEINHKNGDPSDNRPDNLEWVTHQENIIHAFEILGRKPSYGNRKLTDADVKMIRQKYATGGITQQELGNEFGVSNTTISQIVRRQTWKHV